MLVIFYIQSFLQRKYELLKKLYIFIVKVMEGYFNKIKNKNYFKSSKFN